MTGECGECGICGVPHPGGVCRILQRHLDSLELRGHSQATVYNRRRHLARLGRALPVPAVDATHADLLAWRAGLGISAASIAIYVSNVRSFYAWLTAEGIIRGDPAARLPAPRKRRGIPRPISEEDLMRAWPLVPQRVRPWVALAAWCGLRACEIAGLQRGDVLDTARPHPILILTRTKGNVQRIVPIPPAVLAELQPLPHAAGAWLFTRGDGRPGPNTPGIVSQLANRALHGCGVAATLHQLRHWFGTEMYKATRDLRAVQELLGHASPATTAGYTLFDTGRAAAAVMALPVPPRLRAVK